MYAKCHENWPKLTIEIFELDVIFRLKLAKNQFLYNFQAMKIQIGKQS